jgi:hypothetical protein
MRGTTALLLALATSCGGSRAPVEQPAATVAAPAAVTPPPPTGPGVQVTHTGQAQPSFTLYNDYPATQHLFVDTTLVGTIPCGAHRTFPVQIGAHVFTSADSPDPNDNPVRVEVNVESGNAYAYRVFVSGSPGSRCPH